MPEFHSEPYLYLPTVTHKSALVAWGAFYFRVTGRGTWKLVDDSDLKYIHPPRKDSIGAKSAPYGPARVEVYDMGGATVATANTVAANHCWVTGLEPDTEYTYKVFVKDERWAQGERWDWSARDKALVQTGRQYDNRFRTHPDPTMAARSLTFAAIGDFGVGVKTDSLNRRQQQIADALTYAVDTQEVRHEHNFQHSVADGIDYFVTGAAGKFRGGTPDRFEEAHTQTWSNRCHVLLARIDGDRMIIGAIGERGARLSRSPTSCDGRPTAPSSAGRSTYAYRAGNSDWWVGRGKLELAALRHAMR
jgi:hypothetical protein